MKCGRARCKEAEATRKKNYIVLTGQDKKFFISELFKVIQDAIPLILHFSTMCQFRTISSSTFIMLWCAISLHSITNSGLVAGGQISSRERQTVFFTVANPMDKEYKDPYKLDLTKPRLSPYQKKWKVHQATVYCVDIQLAQRKVLKFHQTTCNSIILYGTLPAYCISKAVVMESGEIIYEKAYVSPRPPPKIPFEDTWMKELNQDPSRVVCVNACWTCRQIRRQRRRRRRSLNKNGETHGWTTVHPPRGNRQWLQSARIVTCSCEKKTENFSVQELVKKIESHPHREALQADLQQNNVYNPFSNNSKAMIRE